jgi:hypothetical protein
VAVSRVDDLRSDYDRLGILLEAEADGAKAAAIVRERRMVGELLGAMESPEEVSLVDELASRRNPGPAAARSSSRRRRSS